MFTVRYTDAPARRDELLRRLVAERYVSSARTAIDLGVSDMTIRRDLRQLELDGYAVRVVGGARVAAEGTGAPFTERNQLQAAAKLAIARTAAGILAGTPVVGIDAGTTLAPLALQLSAGTTIVTHSAPVLSTTWSRNDVDLISLGGTYQAETRSFAGPLMLEALSSLSLDVAVLSATAVDADGAMCANAFDAQAKDALARAARSTLMLVDSSKLDRRAPIRFASLNRIATIVTDSGASAEQLAMLRAGGSEVIVAS
jgi:DeoR/GlpR family transcriptional regulator of sugar metabolism